MKNIMAIIRLNKMNETKKALSEIGLPSFMAIDRVMGRGYGNIDMKVLQGAREGHPEAITHLGEQPMFVPKRLLNIVVPDEKVSTVVDKIMEVNCTGKPGDGKIFVCPVTETIRVRTGESGDTALS